MLERFWSALPREARTELVRAAIRAAQEDAEREANLVRFVARATGFREQSIRGEWSRGVTVTTQRAFDKSPARAALFLLGGIRRTRSDAVERLYDFVGASPPHDPSGTMSADGMQVPSSERFEAVLRGEVPDIDVAFARVLIATIADAGIESWRPIAASAIERWAESERVRRVSPVDLVPHAAPTPGGDRIQPTGVAPATGDVIPTPPAPNAPPIEDSHAGDQRAGSAQTPVLLEPHSPLDRLVIGEIVRSIDGTEGAFAVDEIEEVVDELLRLNDRRFASYFHRGFLDALRQSPMRRAEGGDNPARRAWYVAGFALGLRRTATDEEFVSFILSICAEDRRAIQADDGASLGARMLVVPVFLEASLNANEIDEAVRWLPGIIPPVAGDEVLRWALDRMQRDRLDDALRVLRPLRVKLREALRALEELNTKELTGGLVDAVRHQLRESRRLEATALRLSRRFPEAVNLLDALVRDLPCEGGSVAATDPRLEAALAGNLALAKLQIGRIEHLVLDEATLRALSERPPEIDALLRRSERGADSYPPALLVLAASDLTDPTDGEGRRRAIARLQLARELMQAAPDRWTTAARRLVTGLLSALTLSLFEPGIDRAAADLCEALDQGLAIPVSLLREAVEAAATCGTPSAARLVEHQIALDGIRGISALPIGEMVSRAPRLAPVLLDAVDRAAVADRTWAEIAMGILSGLFNAAERPRALVDRCADGLEVRAARDSECRRMLLDFLTRHGGAEVAWNEEERKMIRRRELSRDGRLDELAAELTAAAHAALTDDQRSLAEDHLDALRSLGLGDDPSVQALTRRIEASRPPTSPTIEPSTKPWILVIGGNETQSVYFPELEAWFGHKWPGGRIRFQPTGWSANWFAEIGEIDPKIGHYNAVVLMTFVRTNLGRHVRRRCSEEGRPWVPCTGHGRESLRRAIETAVEIGCLRKSTRA